MRSFGINIACLLVLASLAGCGGGPVKSSVHGTVEFDGTPVTDGIISFLPTEGTVGPSAGQVITDGEYKINKEGGPVPGKYQVQIEATRSKGTVEIKGVNGATGGLSGGGTVEKVEMYIPERYNKNTELTVEIQPGDNEHNFTLKSTP